MASLKHALWAAVTPNLAFNGTRLFMQRVWRASGGAPVSFVLLGRASIRI